VTINFKTLVSRLTLLYFHRLLTGLLGLSLALIAGGCATTQNTELFNEIASLERTAITYYHFLPETRFDTFAKGRLWGAAKGLGGGLGIAVLAPLTGAAYGGPGLAPGMLVGGMLGAALGAIYLPYSPIHGALKAVPANTVDNVETILHDVLTKLRIQETFANYVLSAAQDAKVTGVETDKAWGPKSVENRPNYSALIGKDYDSVLEVGIDQFGFQGGKGADPEIAFLMLAHVRLIRVSDNAELVSKVEEFKSPSRKLSEWIANDEKLLFDEINRAHRELAENVVTDSLFVIDFPVSIWSSYDFCMLKPIYPERDYVFWGKRLSFVPIDSLRPTLKWEAFPREIDLTGDMATVARSAKDIVYDLKVWEIMANEPSGKLVLYERKGLNKPLHQMEKLLNPGTKYYWSVRARFTLHGKPKATQWSFSRIPTQPFEDTCDSKNIPSSNYYRFATP
jgi:hypothetical protein